ncbi:hypothetical protein AMJ47_02930 [Parcubacteria bacterium DG_72]|nr:MAG: hypothetical protein AMJ47_02930 [Parcubacteria bacterium DG_72]
MWRLRYWLCCLSPRYLLSRLGIWLWFRFGDEKTHVVFRHTECGSEVVQLAIFRPWVGPEFQCFQCNALVPAQDVSLRILSLEEVKTEKIRADAMKKQYTEQFFYENFELTILPHIVA